jgi:hypothetical protein
MIRTLVLTELVKLITVLSKYFLCLSCPKVNMVSQRFLRNKEACMLGEQVEIFFRNNGPFAL